MAATGDGNWDRGEKEKEEKEEEEEEDGVYIIDVGELGVVREKSDAATMKCAATRCGLESAGSMEKDEVERRASARKLSRAVMICLFFMAVEIAGGLYANSLAILTDAAHLLTDVAGFALSLFAIWASGWEATPLQTFGYSRLEILGALGSILMIWLLTGILVYEAISRLLTRIEPIDGRVMFFVAAGGLIVNLAMMYMLGDEGHGHSHGHSHGHGHGQGQGHSHFQEDSHSHSHSHSRHCSPGGFPSRERDCSPRREQQSRGCSPARVRTREHGCGQGDRPRGGGQSREPSRGRSCDSSRGPSREPSRGRSCDPSRAPSRDQSRGRSRDASRGQSPRRVERRHVQYVGDRAESGHDQHERDDYNCGQSPRNCDRASIAKSCHCKPALAEPLLKKSHSSSSSSRDLSRRKPDRNINVEGAYLHVLGDLIQSVGVMIGGAAIWYEPCWTVIDPVCTLMFSVLVLWTTLSMIRSTLEVLMESTPREINAQAVERGLLSLPGVVEVHDLHIWAITVGKTLLSCHVRVQPDVNTNAALESITDYCERRFKITHVTIQVETDSS